MKRILSVILCLTLMFSVFSNLSAFAGEIGSGTGLFSPVSLPDMLPYTGTSLNLPTSSTGLIPQIPAVPSAGNAEGIIIPANSQAKPPLLSNAQESPVDTVTGKLIFRNTALCLNGIGLNLTIERNYNRGKTDDGTFGS